MRAFLIAAILLAAGPAMADAEVRNGHDFVRITARPCTDATVLAQITAAGENALDYRAAFAEFSGHAFSGCWSPVFQSRMVHMRYSDGDEGMVPFGALKAITET